MRVAQSLRQRCQLGEAFEAIGGAAQHAQAFVAGGEQREPVLRRRSGRQALVDDAEHLLRRARLERSPGGRDGVTHRACLVPRREGVMSEQGHALGGRVAAGGQHVDERRVDRTPPLGGEQRAGELADLVVREAVVRGRSCGVFEEEARPDGGRQRLGEHRGAAVFLVRPEPHLDRVEILEAEAAAEDCGISEVLLRLVGQPGGPALDQRAHRRREQARGVLGERPRAVDLLDHSQLAVRPGELFHDEGDTLRLGVHRRRARDVDLPAEHLLHELGRLQLREPVEPEAAHHAHALHVGDERHGF